MCVLFAPCGLESAGCESHLCSQFLLWFNLLDSVQFMLFENTVATEHCMSSWDFNYSEVNQKSDDFTLPPPKKL